jgi:RNA polymerase sigma-70 factor (ECF subfamily)
MSAFALRPAQGPDEDRFEELFRAYYSRARGLARRRFPQLDAEEIAQEAMLRVLTHVDSIDRKRNPWPYIATITMNVGRDMTRSLRPTLELDQDHADVPIAPAADETMLQAEVDEGLRSALGRLSPAGRQILTLHAYGDMSIGEIAAFLGCNDNAVRQKLFRARRQFVRVMDEVLAASAAVIGVLGWVFSRPGARRSGRVVIPAGAMTLSGAVFAVLGVATLQLVAPFGSSTSVATTTAGLTTKVAASVHAADTADVVRSAKVSSAAVTAPTLATTAGPAEVTVATPGGLLAKGRETNRERIVVHTPVGDLRLANEGQNGSTAGVVCSTRLISCE